MLKVELVVTRFLKTGTCVVSDYKRMEGKETSRDKSYRDKSYYTQKKQGFERRGNKSFNLPLISLPSIQ
jgi:hypothetical protein